MMAKGPSSLCLWPVAIGLLAATPAPAASIEPPQPAVEPASTADAIAVSPDLARRLTVGVRVNGQGPFPFLIDTGADRTVVSRELAARLALPAGDSATLHDLLGVSQVETVLIDRLDIGQRSLEGVKAAVLREANLGVSGILGIDSLHDRHVLIDLVANRIILEPSTEEIEAAEGNEIVVRAKRRMGQLILVDASAGGVPVSVVLDTGAENSIGNSALRRLLAARGRNSGVATAIVSVTGRSMPAEFMHVGAMKLGGVVIDNMPVTFANVHSFRQFGLARKPAMLLGMDVLRQFEQVSIDFRRKKVRLFLPARR